MSQPPPTYEITLVRHPYITSEGFLSSVLEYKRAPDSNVIANMDKRADTDDFAELLRKDNEWTDRMLAETWNPDGDAYAGSPPDQSPSSNSSASTARLRKQLRATKSSDSGHESVKRGVSSEASWPGQPTPLITVSQFDGTTANAASQPHGSYDPRPPLTQQVPSATQQQSSGRHGYQRGPRLPPDQTYYDDHPAGL